MEDQGKKLLLAVSIVFVIMLGWTYLFPTPEPEKKAEPPGEVDEASRRAAETPAPVPAAATATPAQVERGPEREVVLGFPRFRAVFSTHGGALKSWQLLDEQFRDRRHGGPEDLVRGKAEALWPFQVGFAGSTHAIAVGAEWKLVEQTATRVVFAHTAGPLEVSKTFTVHPDDYLVELTVDAKLASGTAKQSLVVSMGSLQDPAEVKSGSMMGEVGREWSAACLANDEVSTWSSKSLAGKSKEVGGEVDWFGFTYPYFMAAIAIEPPAGRVTCRATGVGAEPGPMLVEAVYEPADVVAGTLFRRKLVGYFGPKYMGKLEAVAAVVGWEETGFERSIDLGWLGFLAAPLIWLLNFFYGLVANWPLAIVLLTMTVKLATLYWTHKSMKSMKAMSSLQPQLKVIKEKYEHDKQRQQIETMNLFKANGVNPLAGCLPMLLQMPIWFALYRALSVAAELYQAPFLWIDDLTAADPFFILPVFMTGMMLVQSLLTPTTATGAQQKMLSYGMPVIFGAMSLFFPAGLTLYISTNSILTLLHHLYIRAQDNAVKVASGGAGGGGKVAAGATWSAKSSVASGRSVIDVEVAEGAEAGSAGAAAPQGRRGGSNGAGGRKRGSRGRGKRRGAQS